MAVDPPDSNGLRGAIWRRNLKQLKKIVERAS